MVIPERGSMSWESFEAHEGDKPWRCIEDRKRSECKKPDHVTSVASWSVRKVTILASLDYTKN